MPENQGKRHPDEHSFEEYVERQFSVIHEAFRRLIERLDKMGVNIAGLEVQEEVLAEAIPFLINEVTTLQTEKTEEQTALQAAVDAKEAAIAQAAGDEEQVTKLTAELATAQGELNQVESVVQKLAPVVAEAEKVLPPKEPEQPTPPAATSPTQPVYTYTPSEGVEPSTQFAASGFQSVADVSAGQSPVELLYFSGDTPDQTETANGGSVPGYTQYIGPTEPVPAPSA